MASIKSIAITALATLAAASPASRRQSSNSTYTLTPSTLSLWDSTVPQVTYNVPSGLIHRGQGKHDTSTLFTFSIPEAYRPNTCSLSFTLSNADSYSDGASSKMQLFYTQRGAAPGATSDFRDRQIASLVAYTGSSGVWGTVDGTFSGLTDLKVPCANLIDRPYLELAPQGDNVDVYFTYGDGLKVTVLGA